MRYILAILISLFFMACGQHAENLVDSPPIIETSPAAESNPLQAAVHAAIIDINTKDIGHSGNVVKTIQADGMEIIRISKKDYYTNEMKHQESDFKDYLGYLDKVSKTKSPQNDQRKLQESKARHNAVMSYLKTMIKTASSDPEIYRVEYYLKADTKNIQYTQLQTTFLDKDLKKMMLDYSFLKTGQ